MKECNMLAHPHIRSYIFFRENALLWRILWKLEKIDTFVVHRNDGNDPLFTGNWTFYYLISIPLCIAFLTFTWPIIVFCPRFLWFIILDYSSDIFNLQFTFNITWNQIVRNLFHSVLEWTSRLFLKKCDCHILFSRLTVIPLTIVDVLSRKGPKILR